MRLEPGSGEFSVEFFHNSLSRRVRRILLFCATFINLACHSKVCVIGNRKEYLYFVCFSLTHAVNKCVTFLYTQ